MATGPDKYQELSDRFKAAAIDARTAAETRFIVPWRMAPKTDLPLGPIKEDASCSTGECGCGISPDDK